MARRLVLVATIASVLLAGCGGDGGGGTSGGGTSGPTATPGQATQASVSTALEALCAMEREPDAATARAAFYDRAHATLHAIAAKTAELEPGTDAGLLIAKQQVESELEEPSLPASFPEDVRALRLEAADRAEAIGLEVPGCDA